MRETNRQVWALERGARMEPDGSVRFSVWAPNARRVSVLLLGGRSHSEHELAPQGGGVFEGRVAGARAGTRYQYRLDGERTVPDPVSRSQPEGVHGPSAVVDPGAFRWSDAGWTGLAMPDYVIYELHVGTFTEEGTFDAAIRHLAELRELGVTAIEIMPVAEFPGARNWGYDGVHLYAPHSAYGGPEGLKRLVDAAHREKLAVVLDVVYNHLGPEGNYLDAYGPYFTEAYKTPWGRALNYDGAQSDEVRRFFIDNALYWVTEYHLDGLRLDAVHGILDFSARHVLADLAEAVHAQGKALGRQTVVIAESDLNDPKMIRSPARCGFGLDAQWADDFHHAVHAALTGERGGYYVDYGDTTLIAKSLADPFVFAGTYSAHRQRHHGAPAVGIPRDRFVVCVQNHDQVGNRAAGERISTLVGFDRQKLAAGLLLLSGYVPLLFMGEEYGEVNPFQYFVSHSDAELVAAVREGRRREFAAFGWGEAVPDPQAEETFRRSKLDRRRAAEAPHSALRRLYGDLLKVRRSEPALRPGDARVRVASHPETGRIALTFTPRRGATCLALFNLGDGEQPFTLPGTELNHWTLLLSTDDARYAGRSGAVAGRRLRGATTISAPSETALLLRKEDV